MSASRWRKADESVALAHCPDHEKKDIFYARIYTIGQGYMYSTTNNDIINLKHTPDSGSGPLRYKKRAIRKCAQELAGFFGLNLSTQFAAVPIPPSKTRAHPLYDDRLEQVVNKVAQICANVIAYPVLEGIMDLEPYHSGAERSAQGCFDAMQVVDTQRRLYAQSTGRTIAVVDDVLTSGAHYEGARWHLQREFPQDRIIGVFWTKAEPLEDDS